MPRFSNSLPPPTPHQGYDIRRTPSTGDVCGIVTCDALTVCDTHYFQGRTTPCERIVNDAGKTIDDTPCPACQKKQPWRTHVYISAYSPKQTTHFIFECTANAAKTFAEYIETHATLRGFAFAARRPKGTANGKVVIQSVAVDPSKYRLPTAPHIPTALAIIWRVPLIALDHQLEPIDGSQTADGPASHANHLRPNPAEMRNMRQPLDDASNNAEAEERRAIFNAQLAEATKPTAPSKNGKKRCTTAAQP